MKALFKSHWPWLITALFAVEVLLSLKPRTDSADAFALKEFGKLPILLGGRVQPIDSMARNSLLLIRGDTAVPLEGNAGDGSWGRWEDLVDKGGLTARKWYQFNKHPKKLKPVEWVAEALARPEVADTRYVFRIHHPELLGELNLAEQGVDRSGLRFYTFNQLRPHLGTIEGEARVTGDVKDELRTPYQKSLMTLHRSLQLYIRLKNSLRPEMSVADDRKDFALPRKELAAQLGLPAGPLYSYNELKPVLEQLGDLVTNIPPTATNDLLAFRASLGRLQAYDTLRGIWRPEWKDDFQAELREFEAVLKPGFEAVQKQQAGQEHDRAAFGRILAFAERYVHMANLAYPMLVPPPGGSHKDEDWANVGKSLMDSVRDGRVDPAVHQYAALATAYAKDDKAAFNRHVTEYRTALAAAQAGAAKKGREEFAFNQFSPFKRAMIIYLAGFLLAAGSWLKLAPNVRRAGFQLVVLGLVVHSVGLIYRMYLEGRPPVTNLYSSAIFVGWGSAGLGALLERINRNGIGAVTAAAIGFITLIIAHNLAVSTGDTMEMMRAVLDTNFWLATHVTTITIGYASTFLAGFLAIVYVLRGILTPSLDNDTAKSIARMVYGIVCFATLLSFVGTILGGIWADQSWGRFWGWDPKENGALLIVIWNATILHLRWGGMIRERGLMNCAIFGNVITAFSWFGVNMLGIGLHSYGFMDAAFKWLSIFSLSQLALIGLGAVPFHYWLSVKRGQLRPPGMAA